MSLCSFYLEGQILLNIRLEFPVRQKFGVEHRYIRSLTLFMEAKAFIIYECSSCLGCCVLERRVRSFSPFFHSFISLTRFCTQALCLVSAIFRVLKDAPKALLRLTTPESPVMATKNCCGHRLNYLQ